MSPYKSRHRSRPLLDASALHPIHINACQNPIIGHQRLEQRTRGPSEHGLPCECARRALRRGRPERRRLVRGCVPRLPLFRSCSAANLRFCYPRSCCCRRRRARRPPRNGGNACRPPRPKRALGHGVPGRLQSGSAPACAVHTRKKIARARRPRRNHGWKLCMPGNWPHGAHPPLPLAPASLSGRRWLPCYFALVLYQDSHCFSDSS